MSAPSGGKKKHTAPAPYVDMEVVDLMKGMGGNGWFNPVSNHQATWPLAEVDEGPRQLPRPLYRMFAWMLKHAVMKGNRRPYANERGHELHLENMGTDLGYEMHNLRTYWRLGVARGLWRDGSEDEGTRRLYLCAKIAPVAEPETGSEPEESQKGVCTNPLPTIFQQLRPYLREQLERLPVEVLREAATRYERIETVEKLAHADILATLRMVTDQQQDTLFQSLGIEKIRNGSKKELTAEEAAEVADRQRRMESLLPHVQGYVQTLDQSVQTPQSAVYEPPTAAVQTPVPGPVSEDLAAKSNGNGTVAGIEKNALPYPVLNKPKRTTKTPGRHPSSQDASVPAPSNPLPKRERSSYTAPEQPREPEPKRQRIDAEAHEALRTLAEQIEQMQKSYKHSDFGLAEFDPISKPGQEFLLRALKKIGGAEHVLPYCLFVAGKFKGLDRNALGKLPARQPGTPNGPRGIGLLLNWADDYALTWRRERARSAGETS